MIRPLDILVQQQRALQPVRQAVERILDVGGTAATGVALERLLLKQVYADYLHCHTWNGTTEGTVDIYVAKNWFLQRTPFDGVTRNGYSYGSFTANGTQRTSTRIADGNTEIQIVIPDYVVGDEIWAVTAATGLLDPAQKAITRIDANLDARMWHEEEAP